MSFGLNLREILGVMRFLWKEVSLLNGNFDTNSTIPIKSICGLEVYSKSFLPDELRFFRFMFILFFNPKLLILLKPL